MIAATLFPLGSTAEDWPGYLGPRRDGHSSERGLLSEWPEAGPSELWRVRIGNGYSSVAVVGDRLFTMYADDGDEWLAAFSTATGAELWRVRTGSDRFDSQGSGPRATPSVDRGLVYALGAKAHLFAVDATSGETRWSHDLDKEHGANVPRWGMSGSPLVEGDLVIVHGGGGKSVYLAFDKASGELRWGTGARAGGVRLAHRRHHRRRAAGDLLRCARSRERGRR